MTEDEWITTENLESMLRFLNDRISERKFRLTECAFNRRFWHLLKDERSRLAVVLTEQYADRLCTREEYKRALALGEKAFNEIRVSYEGRFVGGSYYGGGVSAAQHAAMPGYDMPDYWAGSPDPERFRTLTNSTWIATAAHSLDPPRENRIQDEQRAQTHVLRELFGNPFRPVVVDPVCLTWNNGAVVAVATAVYEDQDYTLLPILLDALDDSGGEDAALLEHLRRPNDHVRGCWAIDAILGKS
jgi:hypothetical protein